MADSMPSELDQLRRENARLIALLKAHGVAWRSSGPAPTEPAPISVHPSAHAPLSPEEKVALFRRLFRGRDNVYALRWQSNSSGRSGYAPACGNEWRPGICEKPRVVCRDCQHRVLLPLTDAAIYGHLAADHTIGLYALVGDDRCHLLAVDFDDQDWRDDARAFLHSCRELTVPAALEALPPDAPRIVRATGRLVGEGFDHPPLDTLLLAMPVSWKGTLQQYAGRLHRQQAGKIQRTDHRLARSRPSCAATHVGAATAGLSGDGVFADF
jgi:hypothetical protein